MGGYLNRASQTEIHYVIRRMRAESSCGGQLGSPHVATGIRAEIDRDGRASTARSACRYIRGQVAREESGTVDESRPPYMATASPERQVLAPASTQALS